MEKEMSYKHTVNFECLRNISKQTTDLYIVHCGYQKCDPGYSYNHGVPDEYHIHFVLNGKGKLYVDKKEYDAKKNDIFIIPKYCEFFYEADKEKPWEYMWVTFDGSKAESYLKRINLTKDNPIISSAVPVSKYKSIVAKILETSELTYANELRRVSFIFELLAEIMDAQNSTRTDDENYDYSNEVYMKHAIKYIEENYNHIKVTDVANYIGINRSYLTTIFKKNLNLSPQRYIIDCRMKIASELLRNSNESIQEIAEKVGYNDCFSFSKTFKHVYSKSPTIFRESFKERC